jgi:hypothetical protein
MRFTFDSDVSAVGGILNWFPGTVHTPAQIAVFNSADILLGAFFLSTGSTNFFPPDSFYGFARAENDIRSFELLGSSIGLRSLTVDAVDEVPEPATWAFMIIGFGAIGAAMRTARRRAVPATA